MDSVLHGAFPLDRTVAAYLKRRTFDLPLGKCDETRLSTNLAKWGICVPTDATGEAAAPYLIGFPAKYAECVVNVSNAADILLGLVADPPEAALAQVQQAVECMMAEYITHIALLQLFVFKTKPAPEPFTLAEIQKQLAYTIFGIDMSMPVSQEMFERLDAMCTSAATYFGMTDSAQINAAIRNTVGTLFLFGVPVLAISERGETTANRLLANIKSKYRTVFAALSSVNGLLLFEPVASMNRVIIAGHEYARTAMFVFELSTVQQLTLKPNPLIRMACLTYKLPRQWAYGSVNLQSFDGLIQQKIRTYFTQRGIIVVDGVRDFHVDARRKQLASMILYYECMTTIDILPKIHVATQLHPVLREILLFYFDISPSGFVSALTEEHATDPARALARLFVQLFGKCTDTIKPQTTLLLGTVAAAVKNGALDRTVLEAVIKRARSLCMDLLMLSATLMVHTLETAYYSDRKTSFINVRRILEHTAQRLTTLDDDDDTDTFIKAVWFWHHASKMYVKTSASPNDLKDFFNTRTDKFIREFACLIQQYNPAIAVDPKLPFQTFIVGLNRHVLNAVRTILAPEVQGEPPAKQARLN